MIQLAQINIYPVKSLDGYSVQSAVVEKRGLQYDRRWMITDADGIFMTQRTNARMALLRAVVDNNFLNIFEKNNPSNNIKIPIKKGLVTEGGVQRVQIWDDSILAHRVAEEADVFLSHFLGKPCHLVTMPDTTHRTVDAQYNTGGDIVSFADGYPILLLGEATMQDLNDRIQQRRGSDYPPLSIRRFRPNLVMSGSAPYEEDEMHQFRIGDIAFAGVKPCARCVLTTRDPDTGIKGKEPLDTLMTYRQVGTKILFGQNVIWSDKLWLGTTLPEVKVGDVVVY